MFKLVSQLEHTVEGKIFQFVCAHDSQIAHAREALCKFLAFIENVEQQAKLSQQQVSTQTNVPVEAAPVVPVVEASQQPPQAQV
jgi:hypothetical protein